MRSFSESQRFNQLFLGLIFTATAGVTILIAMKSWTSDSIVDLVIAPESLAFYIVLLTAILILSIRLETNYDDSGITYQLKPFMISPKLIPFSEIESYRVEDVNPLINYGGWGYRWRPGKILINTQGSYAIVLKRKNKKQLSLGTQEPEKVREVMSHLWERNSKMNHA